jgi:hypothetical protein
VDDTILSPLTHAVLSLHVIWQSTGQGCVLGWDSHCFPPFNGCWVIDMFLVWTPSEEQVPQFPIDWIQSTGHVCVSDSEIGHAFPPFDACWVMCPFLVWCPSDVQELQTSQDTWQSTGVGVVVGTVVEVGVEVVGVGVVVEVVGVEVVVCLNI